MNIDLVYKTYSWNPSNGDYSIDEEYKNCVYSERKGLLRKILFFFRKRLCVGAGDSGQEAREKQ